MSLKLDLHVHSESRGKVFITAEWLRDSMIKNKLDGVAITNFFGISHALKVKQEIKDRIVIVGQEIHTKDGHITGLGLKERIDDFQSAQETIDRIHEQGGIAVAVHPFFYLGLGRKVMSLPIDAIESYNGLAGFSFIHNYLAKNAARKLKIPGLSSSDTTDPRFIGYSHTEVLTDEPCSILETIRSGKLKLFKKAIPFPFIFVLKNLLKFKDLEPCALHPVPCLICEKSMTVRLFREKFQCLDCGRAVFSRIACCNGHYLCLECVVSRSQIYETKK